MIAKLTVRNFKKFDEIEIELDSAVVFVGPNNSGKTSALQAIALWEFGMKKWAEYKLNNPDKKRTAGLTINRQDVLAIPNTESKQLWRDLHVSEGIRNGNSKQKTKSILIQIISEGYSQGKTWKLGLEFGYAGVETFYCRIMIDEETKELYDFNPDILSKEKVGYLPPMSGLATLEDKLEKGSIDARIGEGRTAEVLRNLCYMVYEKKNGEWDNLKDSMNRYFGVDLEPPVYNRLNGQISLNYKEHGKKLNILNSGRGFQQILLLLSYIYAFPNTIILIDEPDAHLEFIRQREIYNYLTEMVKNNNSQLIIATHSEAILNESAEKDKIIVFLGKKPHQVNNKFQVQKSLKEIGFDQYFQAEQKKWVLYLEGSTDLCMLKAFAEVLKHPVENYLSNCFHHYVESNRPSIARKHFYALREAIPDLKGIAIFDRIDSALDSFEYYKELMWTRREIENYLPLPEVIERYVENEILIEQELFQFKAIEKIKEIIIEYTLPIALKDRSNNWWDETKITDKYLDKIFGAFFKSIDLPLSIMDKGKYYKLVKYLVKEELDSEIKEKLDAIYAVAIEAEEILKRNEEA